MSNTPIPSERIDDLKLNVLFEDIFVNSRTQEFLADRFGVNRITVFGMERKIDRLHSAQEQFFDGFMVSSKAIFDLFIASSGYSDLGEYRAGLRIESHNQGFMKCDSGGGGCLFYTPRGDTPLPYTTTGDWATESALFVVRGDDSLRQYVALNYGPTFLQFGAIRQETQGGGWSFINDSDHTPRGFSGQPYVSASGDIIVNFDQRFPKVGGLLVCPDETLALFGITVGASVGLDFAAISMSKEMSLYVNFGDKTLHTESYFAPSVSMVENSDGSFTITHPQVPTGYDFPVMAPDLTGNVSARILDFTSTTITVAPTVPINGSIVFNGSTWEITTSAKVKPTVSFNNGILTVTHQPMSYAQERFAMISPRMPNSPISISSGTQNGLDSFTVEFRDPTTGALLPSVPAGAGFFYRRDIDVISEAGSGAFFIRRNHVKLNANDVFLEEANLWLMGMQITEP